MLSRDKLLSLIMLTPMLGLAQPAQPKVTATTLTVKGYSGQAPVIQVNGKTYVEIEALARLTNGTLSFQGNQTTLSPGSGATAAAAQTERRPGVSKEFLKAVIEEMSVIGEWRTGLVNAVENTNPLTQDWADGYRRNADSKLALASTAVATDPDRSLLVLVRSEFNNMQALSEKYVVLRKNQTFVSPDSLDNDPLNQQIQNCGHGLASQTAGGPFVDVAACH
jgi:hypothetical protein